MAKARKAIRGKVFKMSNTWNTFLKSLLVGGLMAGQAFGGRDLKTGLNIAAESGSINALFDVIDDETVEPLSKEMQAKNAKIEAQNQEIEALQQQVKQLTGLVQQLLVEKK